MVLEDSQERRDAVSVSRRETIWFFLQRSDGDGGVDAFTFNNKCLSSYFLFFLTLSHSPRCLYIGEKVSLVGPSLALKI